MQVDAVVRGPVHESEGGPVLVGSRCEGCGTIAFPAQSTCAKCAGSMVEADLPTSGTVWSWTVQRIGVKPPYTGPAPFEPFVVGYVDLGGVKVETPLFGHDLEGWRIGEPVALCTGGDRSYLQFWFEPREAGK
jgi:uncharacterized OB-fold protein